MKANKKAEKLISANIEIGFEDVECNYYDSYYSFTSIKESYPSAFNLLT